MIFKLIYKLGQKIRNPSLNKYYLFLKETENWTLEALETYQLKKINTLLAHATKHSIYYKLNFRKNTIISLKELEQYPVLTKEILLKNSKDIHTTKKQKNNIIATTSGTSGTSLKFLRNEEADSFNRASSLRGYSWYNVKPWERNGYFWGLNFSKTEKIKTYILDFLQNRYRIFTYKENDIKKFSKKTLKATYIHGYSSMIYQSALLINKLNLPKPQGLKLVKGTSEKVLDSYQKEIQKAFGIKMVNEYGATETGIIAFECPKGKMHINMEGVYVEEINNEILVTNLQMTSFPIIRYKLGDYIKLAPKDKKCTCGLNHRIIEEVTGRIGGNILGKSESYPNLYIYYIFKNLSKKYQIDLNYQVVQNKKGYLEFLIENQLKNKEQEYLELEIMSYFANDIDYLIKDNASFILSKKGKLKNFISNL